jgi:hypothetical protein
MGHGNGGGTNCSGGESDDHRKWKNFAAERLQECFEDASEIAVEKKLAAPHTDKQKRHADAAVMFDSREEQLGSGLAVEVQHKNEGKDILGTTLDYIKQDVAVAWLDASDFNSHGCPMNETDFRKRAREAVSIRLLGNPVPWWLHLDTHVERLLNRIRNDRESINRDDCDHELRPRQRSVSATFTESMVDTLRYRKSDWSALFADYAADHYRAQAAVPRSPTTTNVPARIERRWSLPDSKTLWQNQPWHARFRDEHGESTNDYIREVAKSGRTKLVFGAILPPEFVSQWQQKAVDAAIEPPQTPHDDVQCHNCGKYRYAPSAPMTCENCGTAYNWHWNIQTGRVAVENTPTEITD